MSDNEPTPPAAPTPAPPSTLPIRHVSTEKSNYLRMLIYGPSGAGKTYLSATASQVPEMYPVLLVDTVAESGTMSVTEFDLDVLRLERSLELSKLVGELKSERLPYKTLIVDNLQELYNLFMSEQLSSEAAGKGRVHPQVPARQDYLICTARIRAVLRILKGLEVHLICTCMDQFVPDPSTEVLYIQPMVTGKLSSQVGALFDIVGHLVTESRKVRAEEGPDVSIVRILQTQPAGRIEAKDRSPGGKLGAFLVAPTMLKIAQQLGLTPTQEVTSD